MVMGQFTLPTISDSQTVTKVCCIGAGYVGGPSAAVIANKCPFIRVTVVDKNAERIAAWNSNSLPIYEPFLENLIAKTRNRPEGRENLIFSTDVEAAVYEADLIFLCVNTPTKRAGIGAGKALDLSHIEAAARMIARISRSNKIVVEKSTVPCRTADQLRDILKTNAAPGVHFQVLSNPEFLAEGSIVQDLLAPDRVLIGSLNEPEGQQAATALAKIYEAWIPLSKIVPLSLWSSELAKMSANALLAQRISSINSLSAICEATQSDISEVAYAAGLDKRIGPHMLKASVGFGGSCFKKDVLGLVYLAESLNLFKVADYWRQVVEINEWQKTRFTERIIHCLYNSLSRKRVAVLGFTYKKNTSDIRESSAIVLVNSLIIEGAIVTIYDPQAPESQILSDLYQTNKNAADVDNSVFVCKDAYKACKDTHAVVVMTDWDEFSTGDSLKTPAFEDVDEELVPKSKVALAQKNHTKLDWPRIASLMHKPMFVFDGRLMLDQKYLESLGFRVESIGSSLGNSMYN